MKKPTEWKVGESVYLRDENDNRSKDPNFVPPIVTISKIGRTSVYSKQYRVERAYRKDDGKVKDQYGRSWLQTFFEYEEQKAIALETKRLKSLGLSVESRDFSSTDLCRIANLVDVIRKDDESERGNPAASLSEGE